MTNLSYKLKEIITKPATPFVIYILLIILSFFYGPVLTTQYLMDDGWIHQIYARNIEECKTLFVYNNCTDYQSGETSPLWAILLSIAYFLHLEPVFFSKVFAGIFSLLSMLVVSLLYTDQKKIRLFSLYLLALSPYWLWATLGGMEGSLAALLTILSLYQYSKKKFFSSFFIVGIGLLVRPELLLLYALLVIYDFWISLKTQSCRSTLKRSVFYCIPLLLYLPFALYNLSLYQNPLPATIVAKQAPLELGTMDLHFRLIRFATSLVSMSAAINFLDFFIPLAKPLFSPLSLIFNSIIFIAGIAITSLLALITFRSVSKKKIELLMFLYVILFILGVCWSIGAGLWGPRYEYRRFILPVYPLLCVLLAHLSTKKKYERVLLFLIIISIICVPLSIVHAVKTAESFEQWKEYYIQVNKIKPDNISLALLNVGTPRYFLSNDVVIYDLVGLNHYQVLGKDRLFYALEQNATHMEQPWFTGYINTPFLSKDFEYEGAYLLKINKEEITQEWIQNYEKEVKNASFKEKIRVWSSYAR